MDLKAPLPSLSLHKEIRVGLEPSSQSSIVQLQLPSTSTFSLSSRVIRKTLDAIPTSHNEEEFRKRHIASAGSIHFRNSKRYPRSILWRCLEGNTVLELRSVDLSKNQSESRDARVVLRFVFPSSIRSNGIALADSTEEDILNAFVLTKNNELYTLTLRSNCFCRGGVLDDDFTYWCKTFKASSLTISTPFRLTANGPLEVLIALTDGRLVRLTRKQGDDGSNWDEAAYNEGQWGSSLRGLIRWQGSSTVRYEGNSLDQNTVVEASLSPDGEHILAVGLSHTLKFWNIASGKPSIAKDLLDVRRAPHDLPKIMLDPGIPKVIEVFEAQTVIQGDLYYALTFSPHSLGIFKVWAIRDADNASGFRDLFPDDVLRAPDPDDGALWTVSDFKIKSAPGSAGLDIWILMRLNRRYKLYSRKFSDFQTLGEDWQYDWTTTAIDTPKREPANEAPLKVSDLDSDAVTEKWLQFIFSPGRLPEAVLETAYSIYAGMRGLPPVHASRRPLKEQIVSNVGSQIHLQHSQSSDAHLTKFREDMHGEWSSLWNIAVELDQLRSEPLSLSLDHVSDIAWVVLSDSCGVVRECAEVEIFAHNKSRDLSGNHSRAMMPSVEMDGGSSSPQTPDELALLIEAAAKFRSGFSESLRLSYQDAIKSELWQDSLYSVPVRIQAFYDRCNFAAEVDDRQFDELVASLKDIGGFEGLATDSFLSVIEVLPGRLSGASELVSTKFGLKMMVKGAQDMIALHARVISDFLVLVAFIDMEIDREESSLDNLDTAAVYTALVDQLREIQTMQWLASSTRMDSGLSSQANAAGNSSVPETMRGDYPSSVLENLFARDIKPQSHTTQSEAAALTQTIRDLLTWVVGGNEITLDQVLVNIQCDLLKNNNLELACSFDALQPQSAWAIYIRGRLRLMQQDYNEAAIHFKKAAYKLCKPHLHILHNPPANSCFPTSPPNAHLQRISRRILLPPRPVNGLFPRYWPSQLPHPHHEPLLLRARTHPRRHLRATRPAAPPLPHSVQPAHRHSLAPLPRRSHQPRLFDRLLSPLPTLGPRSAANCASDPGARYGRSRLR